MKNLLTFLFISVLLFGLWQCEDPYAFPKDSVIEMSKTPCFGACPEYDFKIDGKGNATYEGKSYVKLEGKHDLRFPPETVNELFQAFADGDFWSYENEYTDNISDLPTTYLTFIHEGQSKKIKDYYGAPESLKILESKVEALLDMSVWQ